MATRVDEEVNSQVPSYLALDAIVFAHFAKGHVNDSIFATYFSHGVSRVSKQSAGQIGGNFEVQFAAEKTIQSVAKQLYR